jgi:hypothetical protein
MWREAGKGWVRNRVLEILITVQLIKKPHYFKKTESIVEKPVLNGTWA